MKNSALVCGRLLEQRARNVDIVAQPHAGAVTALGQRQFTARLPQEDEAALRPGDLEGVVEQRPDHVVQHPGGVQAARGAQKQVQLLELRSVIVGGGIAQQLARGAILPAQQKRDLHARIAEADMVAVFQGARGNALGVHEGAETTAQVAQLISAVGDARDVRMHARNRGMIKREVAVAGAADRELFAGNRRRPARTAIIDRQQRHAIRCRTWVWQELSLKRGHGGLFPEYSQEHYARIRPRNQQLS